MSDAADRFYEVIGITQDKNFCDSAYERRLACERIERLTARIKQLEAALGQLAEGTTPWTVYGERADEAWQIMANFAKLTLEQNNE